MKHSIKESLAPIFKNQSYECLHIITDANDIELTGSTATSLRYHSYFSGVAISCQEFRGLFRVHYFLEDLDLLVRTPANKTAFSDYIDAANEFCNVVSGRATGEILGHDGEYGISAPFFMEGFNQVYFELSDGLDFIDSWQLAGDKLKLKCSLMGTL